MQKHSASCECGFHDDVYLGGLRHASENLFPFYCEGCGLVSVDINNDQLVCPKCGCNHISQYGLPPVTIPPMPDPSECLTFSERLWSSLKALLGIKKKDMRTQEEIFYALKIEMKKQPIGGTFSTGKHYYEFYQENNLCPKCKQMTMQFSDTLVFMD